MLSHWQMQALIGLLVFVLLVQAQLAIDDFPTSGVEAGKSYTITYSPKDQTVSP